MQNSMTEEYVVLAVDDSRKYMFTNNIYSTKYDYSMESWDPGRQGKKLWQIGAVFSRSKDICIKFTHMNSTL